MHSLKIKSEKRGQRLFLDDFELKGITHYEIKHSDWSGSELTLKIIVSNENMEVDLDGEVIRDSSLPEENNIGWLLERYNSMKIKMAVVSSLLGFTWGLLLAGTLISTFTR